MTRATLHTRPDVTEPALLRTTGGTRLHLAPCPHIVGVATEPATAEDRAAIPVCSWCQAELDGTGRTYADTLDDAMRAFGTWSGTERAIREALAGVEYDAIWLPYSRSYIALGRDGTAVAWVGKSYVAPARDTFVELPGYTPHTGGGSAHDPAHGTVCPVHNLERSLAGTCDDCD